jgi:serine protease
VSRSLRAFCIVACAALVASLPAHAQDAASRARVIVKLKPDSRLAVRKSGSAAADRIERAEALGARVGRAMQGGPAISEHAQVVFATGVTSTELARLLAREPDVEYAVPDERVKLLVAPNDPLYATGAPGAGPDVGQWYLRAPAGPVRSSIDAEAAWSITTGSAGIVVAVVDSGVRFDHPDLAANLLPGFDFVSDASRANDGDGRDADASDPGDWLTEEELADAGGPLYDCNPTPRPSTWHGTKVASVIAALTNNGVGMASVAHAVRVLPVRVIGKCTAFVSDVVAGIRWAAGLVVPGAPSNPTPARVINVSLGSDNPCAAVYQQALDEVTARGSIVVVAGGNTAGHPVGSPANCLGAVGVAGVRHVGTKSGFSALGPEMALAAPAGNCVNTAVGSPCLYPIVTATNSGTTTPGQASYTDAFNVSAGTSFAVPLVSGTAALMLSARPGLSPIEVRQLLQATARVFPVAGGTDASVPQCVAPSFDGMGELISQLECYCTTTTCGAGMLDAGAAVAAASAGRTVTAALAEGIWWAAPAGIESGWGLNVAQQGNTIFATWFTYDGAGRPWWLSMSATNLGNDTYAAPLHENRGPPFNAIPFLPSQVTSAVVGDATLAFSDSHNGTFSYRVNGIQQTKAITRVAFAELPSCTSGLVPDLSAATNYQDIWWNAPPGSESGWGINLVHQGDTIFATWFTYDADGRPLWLSMTAQRTSPGTYAGTLYTTAGPPFSAVPFNPARIATTPVGTGTLTFANGNAGTFAYTVNGISQAKPITRTVFRSPGTTCR